MPFIRKKAASTLDVQRMKEGDSMKEKRFGGWGELILNWLKKNSVLIIK